MKKNILCLLLFSLQIAVHAQDPLWLNKAKETSITLLDNTWNADNGLLSYGMSTLAELQHDMNLSKAVETYLQAQLNEDGSIKDFHKGQLDHFVPGKTYLHAFKFAEQKDSPEAQKLKKAFDWMHSYLVMSYPRIKKNIGKTGFLHQDNYYNQMWLQDLYTGSTFYAQWLAECDVKNNAGWSDIAVQFITMYNQAFNKVMKLCYPHWSADASNLDAFWARRDGVNSGTSREFTALGTAYYMAALIEVLEVMPKSQVGYNQLIDILKDIAAGVKDWQDDATGCWYQLIAYNSDKTGECGNKNYVESTASNLLAYSLLKGIRLGLLDKSQYEESAAKAFNGIVKAFVNTTDNFEIKDATGYIGIGNSTEMTRDGSVDYYLCGEGTERKVNDKQSFGAFLLATSEWLKK